MQHPDPAPTDLLTVAQTAQVLQVSGKTVRKWADRGDLAAVRTPGGHRRFRRADVDALFDEAAAS